MSIESSPMSPSRSLALSLLTLTALPIACRTSEQARTRGGGEQPMTRGTSELADATPRDPLRPQPPRGPTVQNHPDPPSSEAPPLERLQLPPGFAIELYTDKVPHARSLARGPKGVVFVSTRRDDRVFAVVDQDGDHHVDEVHTIADNLEVPNGIAYRAGDLYVAEIDRILRFPQIDGRLANPPAPELFTDALPSSHHHGWRYIRFAPDGLLYISIGAPCDTCLSDDPIFATIARMRPESRDFEIFASGVRNSLGFDWHPDTGGFWFTENGRDELGEDIPPDELNRAPTAGLHFGYPHCHGGVILDPQFGEGHTCTEFTPPEQNLAPHVAVLGMRFYSGTMFPARYRNAAIMAEHGSWNRTNKIGYRVMVVPIEGDRANGYEPLVEGFLDPQRDEAWGRPVDVELLDDGSLLISDDWKGAIYRLSYAGA